MTSTINRGKADAWDSYIRFDEGVISSANPRRGFLHYKDMNGRKTSLAAFVALICVAAFGFVDCSDEFAAKIRAAADGSEVVIPSGDHYLAKSIRIQGKRNFTLRGEKGARFVLHFSPRGSMKENANGISCGSCQNLIIENLAFTTDNPVNVAGRVTAVDAANDTFDITVDPGLPFRGDERILSMTTFGEDGAPDGVFETFEPQPQGRMYEFLGDHRIRITFRPKPDPRFPAFDIRSFRPNHRIVLRHQLNGNAVFGFGDCHGVTLRDIEIERAGSAGTGIAPPCSDFRFERYNIRSPKGSPALYTENSDGIHVVGMSGSVVLEDCHFDGMGDDCLNVHCKAGEVKSFDPTSGVLVCIGRNTARNECALPPGWAKVGDELFVYDRKTLLEKGRAKLTAYSSDGRGTVAVPNFEIESGDYLANSRDFPSVRVSNCTFANNRARGLLLQSHHMLIENSRFSGISSAGVLIAPDIVRWNECGPAVDVEVRNCTFERIGRHGGHSGIVGALAVRTTHGLGSDDVYPAGFHRNIRIVGNRFTDCGRSGVFMAGVKGGLVVSNVFERCGSAVRPGDPEGYREDIRLVNCEDVLQ